ncbi:signal peptidase I [Niallia sp. NCCP-28]|uniref:signal peptidase I n=1 Tax=Niallia sp. NCCP-28 TaxID=2934712 RepID=UPI00208D40A5|nr:signal peptidase I [Niallia sp. NCCP-28]GKU82740.1 signal peptidase I [Niallia sp. NCCP-28]
MNHSAKKELISWIKSFLVAVLLVFLCRQFLFTPTTVLGASMSPTFENGNKVILNKQGKINRFDMIVFHAPDSKENNYIKRVIGLPGDKISFKDDVLYVNGQAYKESYLEENKKNSTLAKITEDFTLKEKTGDNKVPEGYYFVMGDNRLKSKDSRDFGFIRKDAIIGKVVLRFYPLSEFGSP